jgi:hypothetical protein
VHGFRSLAFQFPCSEPVSSDGIVMHVFRRAKVRYTTS